MGPHANSKPTQLRDVSSAQPRLPIEPTTWNNWRFMLRARRVRVEGPEQLKLKLFYLAIAGFTDQLLKGVDVGKFALPIGVILHDLQLSEKPRFYRLRPRVGRVGLAGVETATQPLDRIPGVCAARVGRSGA